MAALEFYSSLEMMEFENYLILLCEAKVKVLRRQKYVLKKLKDMSKEKKIQVIYCKKISMWNA